MAEALLDALAHMLKEIKLAKFSDTLADAESITDTSEDEHTC